MSVLNGKVMKTKTKFQQQGKNVKNIKIHENQNNKQSPTSIKVVKVQKIEKGVKSNECDETRKSKNSPSIESASITSKIRLFAASEKCEATQSQNLHGVVRQKFSETIKSLGKKTSLLRTTERNGRFCKNKIKVQYNPKLQEQNSKGNIIKSCQTKDNFESEFELASDDGVLESDISEDEQMESSNIEDEVEMNNDDEEIESDTEFEEMESEVEDEEIKSDAEDEEIESYDEEKEDDDEEIQNNAKDEDVESNTKVEDVSNKSMKSRELERAENTVFVSNFDNDLDRDTLQKYFEKAGEVRYVYFFQHHNKPRCAFVKMSDSKGFEEALWLNGTLLFGRHIIVKPHRAIMNKMLRRDIKSVDGTTDERKIDQCGINNTVFVANLDINLDKEINIQISTVRKHFEKAGEISKFHLFLRHKPAYGFIEMSDSNGFQKALSLNLTMLLGQRIHVDWNKTKEMLKSNKKIEGISAKCTNLKTGRDGIKNRTVFVSNLNSSIDEKIIRKYFEKAGEIRNLELRHKQKKGFITMSDSNGFERALSLHGTMLLGQRICVRPYRPTTHTAMYMPNHGIRHAKYVKGTLIRAKDNRNTFRRISTNNRNIGRRISIEQSNKKTSRYDTCSSNNKYVKGIPVARMNPKYNWSLNKDKGKSLSENVNRECHVRRTPVINKSTLSVYAKGPIRRSSC